MTLHSIRDDHANRSHDPKQGVVSSVRLLRRLALSYLESYDEIDETSCLESESQRYRWDGALLMGLLERHLTVTTTAFHLMKDIFT